MLGALRRWCQWKYDEQTGSQLSLARPIALKMPWDYFDSAKCSPKCSLAMLTCVAKLLKRMEPTIGLEPMTCRLRMRRAGFPPVPFNDLCARSGLPVSLNVRQSHVN